jgi:hypothetical protein
MSVFIFVSFNPLLSSEIFLFFEPSHPHAELFLTKYPVDTGLFYYHLVTLSVLFIFEIFACYLA